MPSNVKSLGDELSINSGDFLHWIHSRLCYVFKDSDKLDFMVRLKKLAEEIEKEETEMSEPYVPGVDVKKVKPYVIQIKVVESNRMMTEFRQSYFKSDYPEVRFWDTVLGYGKRWSDKERIVSLLDGETDKEMQACTIRPKVS